MQSCVLVSGCEIFCLWLLRCLRFLLAYATLESISSKSFRVGVMGTAIASVVFNCSTAGIFKLLLQQIFVSGVTSVKLVSFK